MAEASSPGPGARTPGPRLSPPPAFEERGLRLSPAYHPLRQLKSGARDGTPPTTPPAIEERGPGRNPAYHPSGN
ncbi:hypothetical protein GCM10022420_032180 [Streptomyces iranensis]